VPPLKDAQKKPAAQGLDAAVVLAAARQKPLGHARHEALLVKAAPLSAYVPTGHAFAATVAAPVAVGQK
jgi:hypothetical protein